MSSEMTQLLRDWEFDPEANIRRVTDGDGVQLIQVRVDQGAFQGMSPKEAYFVKCDKETTTQNDINSGNVNIVVGFAPLKPAEFVIIKLQQMAGQIQS